MKYTYKLINCVYYLWCYLSVSYFGSFPVFSISHFTVFLFDPCFLFRYPWFLRQNLLLRVFHVLYRAPCTSGGGGVPWVMWRNSWPRTRFYAGVWFNPPTQFPILDPSLAPFPTGDWGFELRGSYVSSTLQPRFWFNRLPTPVLAKGVLPFLLPWSDSIAQVRPGLLSLSFHPLKEQKEKNCFCWLLQCLPCLSFLIVSHQYRSPAIG